MRKLEWLKNTIDWIIRLQGAYAILAAIVAGGIGTVVRAILSYQTRVPGPWITPIWVFSAAIALGALLILGSRLGSPGNYPAFELFVASLIWIYDDKKDWTVFYIASRLVNRGAPSITQGWSATYTVGPTVEPMTGYYLVGPAVLTVGAERLTIENEDLLSVKSAEKAVERGGAVHGRLVFTLPGNRDAQIKALQCKIEVKVQDYTSREYSTVYIPSSKPTPTLLRHPFERGEFIKPEEATVEAPALPSGEGELQ
jgi:hypothetical protein